VTDSGEDRVVRLLERILEELQENREEHGQLKDRLAAFAGPQLPENLTRHFIEGNQMAPVVAQLPQMQARQQDVMERIADTQAEIVQLLREVAARPQAVVKAPSRWGGKEVAMVVGAFGVALASIIAAVLNGSRGF